MLSPTAAPEFSLGTPETLGQAGAELPVTGRVAQPHALLRMDSPIGRILLIGNGEAVTSLTIERNGKLPYDGRPERGDDVLELAAVQLGEYFAARRRSFHIPVQLTGTPFQCSVWEQLTRIEFGDVVSYGYLGRVIGRPTAVRAVGGAIGANPVPIIVPCHRVLGTNDRITGYSGGNGIPTKSWLLDHEGVEHRL